VEISLSRGAATGLLLDNLPRQLPLKSAANSAFSAFLYFELDTDLLEKTGCGI